VRTPGGFNLCPAERFPMGTESNLLGTDWKLVGTKKEAAGAALKRRGLEKLKSGFRVGICKEIRNSFNNTKNSLILAIDRILGFRRIYYHDLDTDYAEGHGLKYRDFIF
jgi:hypothetical protein